jgi:hypothetical protein
MTAALKSLDFNVETLINAGRVRMEEAVERFKNKLRSSKTSYGFLFYAGHGVQSGGENYLIPVDADIRTESYLRDRAVSVQAVLDELNAAGNALNVVILDACRDNPFSWKRGGSRGLIVVRNQPADSIIVYATSAGSTAADGGGRNGLFTGQLLKHLKTPGLEINEVFRLTGGDVARASGGAQRPAVYNQFYGTAWLAGKPAASRPAQTPAARPSGGGAMTIQPAARPAPQQPAARPQSAAKVYALGDIGPAGGWVFYDKGAYSGGWRYLEAAPRNAGGDIQWGLFDKDVSGTGTAVGTGKRNTRLILEALGRAGQTGMAAQLCAAFAAGGFKDWFLPSRDELNLMYKNLKVRGLGNFQPGVYWSSSGLDDTYAWDQYFVDGTQNAHGLKANPSYVRAARAF